MGIRVNADAGYRIIETVRIDASLEVVMGQNMSDRGTPYVTWLCKNATDYYWGHYRDDYDDCRRHLFERVLDHLPKGNGGQSNAAE